MDSVTFLFKHVYAQLSDEILRRDAQRSDLIGEIARDELAKRNAVTEERPGSDRDAETN